MVNALAIYNVCRVKKKFLKRVDFIQLSSRCAGVFTFEAGFNFLVHVFVPDPAMFAACMPDSRKKTEYYQDIIWIALYPEEYFILKGFALRGSCSPY